jgi:hypothetical protein
MAEGVEVGMYWQASNRTNDHRGTKCWQRHYGEDKDWKFWNDEGFSRDGAINLAWWPETIIVGYSYLSCLAKRIYCVEFSWVVNYCFKYDMAMKHATSSGLLQLHQGQEATHVTWAIEDDSDFSFWQQGYCSCCWFWSRVKQAVLAVIRTVEDAQEVTGTVVCVLKYSLYGALWALIVLPCTICHYCMLCHNIIF